MTKAQFEAIAATLNANRADYALVADFADMCEEFNPNFDRARFIATASDERRKDLQSEMRRFDREIGMEID